VSTIDRTAKIEKYKVENSSEKLSGLVVGYHSTIAQNPQQRSNKMAQIVSATVKENGNFVIEFKPLDSQRASKSGDTVQVAGTNGWAEPLVNLTGQDPEGRSVPLTAAIQVRYRNPYKTGSSSPTKKSQPVTAELLKKKAQTSMGKTA